MALNCIQLLCLHSWWQPVPIAFLILRKIAENKLATKLSLMDFRNWVEWLIKIFWIKRLFSHFSLEWRWWLWLNRWSEFLLRINLILVWVRQLQEFLSFFCSWHMVLRFPVLSDPASCSLKVSCHVDMLLLPCDIGFNATSSMTPLLYHSFLFFISPLISKFLVLTINPEFFKFLLPNFTCGLVSQIVWLAFESIFLVVSSWLVWRKEGLEWIRFYRFVIFFKLWESWNRYCSGIRSC